MPLAVVVAAVHDTGRAPSLPASARRLRLPLHQRSQQRMVERWGFNLDASDAPARAVALRDAQPDDADRQILVASVLASRGDDAAALVAARRAVELAPGSARAHTTLATLLARARRPDEALHHAQRAAASDPDDPTVRYNRGLMFTACHQRAAARADFAAAAALLDLPQLPAWRHWLGGG